MSRSSGLLEKQRPDAILKAMAFLQITTSTVALLFTLVACSGESAPEANNGNSGGSPSHPEGGDGGGGGLEPSHLGVCSPLSAMKGFEKCEEGYSHRVSAQACENFIREELIASGNCGIEGDCCESDEECSAESACWKTGVVNNEDYGTCRLRCETDADCADDQLCECGEGAGRCVKASCHTDSDCEGEALCVSSTRDEGCGEVRTYSCQKPSDECRSDDDCDQSGEKQETCADDGNIRACLSQYQSCDS